MTWKPLLAVSARFLVPLLFAAAALLAIAINYQLEIQHHNESVQLWEQKRLRERLGVEQSRLEHQLGLGNLMQVRRLVSSLPLHSGITHAWLIDDTGRILAALSRTELGKPLESILDKESVGLRTVIGQEILKWHPDIHILAIEGEQAMLAAVGIQPNLLLLVSLDLRPAMTEQLALGQHHLFRQAVLIVLFAGILASLLHVLWFRRAAQLTATAIAMGNGNFEVRTLMDGRDELATVGAALDSLAVNQQRYQAELRQLLSKLENVANASPALFWTSGLDKGCTWFNQRWLDFTGRSMSQEQGDGWTEGVHPDDLKHCLAIYVASFNVRESFSMEYRLRRHDGEYRWFLDQGMPRYDADGHFLGYIGSCLDITEHKKLHKKLTDSEAYYRYLFEHNPAPMLIYEQVDLQLLSVNEAFLRNYGYKLKDALALKLPDLYPESEQAAIIGLAGQLRGHANVGEWHHRKYNDEFMDVLVHSHDLVYAGQACRVMVIIDITERKRAELNLQLRNEELEQFNVASVNRELAMIDLKRQINELSKQLGQPQPFDLSFINETSTQVSSLESGQSS